MQGELSQGTSLGELAKFTLRPCRAAACCRRILSPHSSGQSLLTLRIFVLNRSLGSPCQGSCRAYARQRGSFLSLRLLPTAKSTALIRERRGHVTNLRPNHRARRPQWDAIHSRTRSAPPCQRNKVGSVDRTLRIMQSPRVSSHNAHGLVGHPCRIQFHIAAKPPQAYRRSQFFNEVQCLR